MLVGCIKHSAYFFPSVEISLCFHSQGWIFILANQCLQSINSFSGDTECQQYFQGFVSGICGALDLVDDPHL